MTELVHSFFRDDHVDLPEVGCAILPPRFASLLPEEVLCMGTNFEGVSVYEWFGYVAGHPVRLVFDDRTTPIASVMSDDVATVSLIETALLERSNDR